MRISDLVNAMESLAPTSFAEEWDNVGLLVGSPDAALDGPVLLTIDLSEDVLAEAVAAGARAVIAYHPVPFEPQRRLVDSPTSPAAQRVVVRALESRIAIYSPHTALDAVEGGVTDWLADGLLGTPGSIGAGGDRRALRAHAAQDSSAQFKIVTFVPGTSVDEVRSALASAGAGRIGEYDVCSFAAPGTGTFFGREGTSPAVGKAGRLESIPEVRLEMVCSRRSIALAVATLREFHPYEEPAIDVYPLQPAPRRAAGAGRRITLDQPATLDQLADRLKAYLQVHAVQVGAAKRPPGDDRVMRIGVVPGAGAKLLDLALAEECEVFVTGEMKHHEVNAALAAGMSVILGGHTATERGYLPTLARRLKESLPNVTTIVSREDRDPLRLRGNLRA